MALAYDYDDYRAFVDAKQGVIDRRIFSDEQIYQFELERVFARAWNFMCHESMIPNAGDFFLSYIGEESVICARDKKGGLQVFLNSCRHRGNAVCRAEKGNTRSFLCTYHGWTYDLEGKLIGVPGYKDLYHEQLDRSQWGLVSAGKVQSYKGFVFATMDPRAPDLEEYLGPVGRLGINIMAARGDTIAVDGIQKNQIGCNWKLAVDNVFDYYHAPMAHASASLAGYNGGRVKEDVALMREVLNPKRQRALVGEYGHCISGPRLTEEVIAQMDPDTPALTPMVDEGWRRRPGKAEILGEAGFLSRGHPNIFPNMWIASGGTQISLRLPKGPMKTEIWWFTLVDKNLSEELRAGRVMNANHTFGPSGMLEQEDGENWDQSTRGTQGVVARRYPLNFQMNLGLAQVKEADGAHFVDTHVNEHAQLWTWNSWADWMNADSWDDLRTTHVKPPPEGAML